LGVLVFVLDTALSAASAAIVRDGQVLAARTEPMDRGHAERIAGIVRTIRGEAGVAFDAVTRIGVTVGPGSFTGLRVGLAFAKGLALALSVPCVGVGTLAALAKSAGTKGRIAAVLDARRGQVYLQIFEDERPLNQPEVLKLDVAQARLDAAAGPVVLIGSGAALLRPPPGCQIAEVAYIDPVALAQLTASAPEPIQRPEPLYLRAPDARTIAERAAG
jgi:tRNA threonylcarbamoyladenosine biosynthesis protein TsaB